MGTTKSAIEVVFREESGAVLATLIRIFGDFDRAEEALQEALVSALESWSPANMPTNPGAWLMTSARRKAIDRLRRDKTAQSKAGELTTLAALEAAESSLRGQADGADSPYPDDLLRLIFCCCNPALSQEAQVALTLRTVCGLTTAEIARSFLVPEATMAQRLVRAKKKIRAAGIPFRLPADEDLPERMDSVLAVVYLIFNEGYFASSDADLVRCDLCDEALQLASTLGSLVPDQPELGGLRALMLLQDSRRDARVSASGELIVLGEQDRALWNPVSISAGQTLIKETLALGRSGPYQLQAAIAAVHSEAKLASETDWAQIIALYEELRRRSDSPIVRLNQIVAISMVEGPERALALLAPLADTLADYQSYHAACADFHRQLAQLGPACEAYKRARALCENPTVDRYYQRRIDECASPT